MSIARHHAEWLSLLETSGPFLSMPVLLEAFPQGLDAHDAEHHRTLRFGHGEWEDNRHQPATHAAWIKFVLAGTLDYSSDVLAERQAIPQTLQAEVPEHAELLQPDFLLHHPGDPNKPRLLIQTYPHTQDLERPVAGLPWKASPDTRMAHLLHATGVRLGLVTNGERWMLVNAPRSETTGFASWYATLWLEEPITFRAFRSLLGVQRFFGVKDEDTPEQLLARSAANQQEVTDQLGYQVRRAVEVLIQSLDRADQDRQRELLRGIGEAELYEAALTVMMRLVFLFCAEERELLLLGDPIYDQHYAVSTIREQLQQTASQYGEEILERRHDAWCRLLVAFRAVHGGVWHDDLKLPAYGGHLFDPDRFPFLEGRKPGTSWRATDAVPLPVNNRTALHLLESLQTLETRLPGDREVVRRRLSFRSLDIEQIGHVYEGLLDHTARRASEPHLGLAGTKDKEPEVPLAELEARKVKGEKDLLAYLKEATGKSEPALRKLLAVEIDGQQISRFRAVCQGDDGLWQRVKSFAGLVREDSFGYPVVIPTGSVYVTEGTDRRSSGTHYTPHSLTEPIVQYTLEPLVYAGPAEGLPRSEWKLRSAKELLNLKVCDMACGSGAFLVQACRYLGERLEEAWAECERLTAGTQGNLFGTAAPAQRPSMHVTPYGDLSKGSLYERIIPVEDADRRIEALRMVAQRCLYGVDKNPLAVEMAKLSLWLLTLAKDRPFEFIDHAIRCGDSLVGIRDLKQLEHFSLDGEGVTNSLFLDFLRNRIPEAIELRRRIEAMPANTVEEVEQQERLLAQAEDKLERLRLAADLLLAAELVPGTAGDRISARDAHAIKVAAHFHDADLMAFRRESRKALGGQPTFHWPLEFAEVMVDRGGFDAFVCNPPFMGGKKITGNLGDAYREYVVAQLAKGRRGNSDLCAYFFLRACQLLRDAGQLGFLATNTIAQGDTREVGLDQLTANTYVIPRAVPSRPWPGSATLEIAHVWLRKGRWSGEFVLDEKPTTGITPFLTVPGAVVGNPSRLKANSGKSFQGSVVLGMGFVLSPDEATALIAKNARNRDVLFSYLNGEDLNSRPDQSASRWVINFFDWPLEKAREYPDCFRIVEEKVKPEREILGLKKDSSSQGYAKWWWQYGRRGEELYRTIAGMDQVIVVSLVSNKVPFAIVPADQVFAHKLAVFALQGTGSFTLMQSSFHYHWCWHYSSTMRTDLNYSPSDCFETFPFPASVASLDTIGERYHAHRRSIMVARQEGLTKTYNRFHNPEQRGGDFKDIDTLRELHVEMDRAVAAAYGWSDLDLGHGFHDTRQGLRFTISEAARREVLARLLKLNHERYAEEVRQGLHERKKTTTAKKPRKVKANTDQGSGLFE
jgi:hypothetical protein